jgi:hypothetical protein
MRLHAPGGKVTLEQRRAYARHGRRLFHQLGGKGSRVAGRYCAIESHRELSITPTGVAQVIGHSKYNCLNIVRQTCSLQIFKGNI